MKHIFRFTFLLIVSMLTLPLFAQSADNEDEVIKIDERNYGAYRPNEVIVHFKEDGAVQMRAPRRAKFATSAVSAVDQLFATLGVDSIEELMPRTGTKPMPRRVRTYSGKDIEPKRLGKLYRLKLSDEKQQSVFQVINQLQALEEVDYAEPNYLVFALGTESTDVPVDEIPLPIYSDKRKYIAKAKQNATNDSATYVQEPLYSQQWGIEAINLHKLWNKPKITTKRPVIAILDTGVDIEHPDLAANIWTNETEANGVEGQDDDANGFTDDIHGWDFINQKGQIRDFNGHGTHCAGIAGAVGNNGIGITGANPDALIMPITVMQSNGTGDVATIVKGIDYAAANGADVISMSIGGYNYSVAEEQALGRAYANAVLVAAAGNDGHAMAGAHCLFDAPMFPAAFTFVLGVEASVNAQGALAGFSNFDETGPIYSSFSENELYNYELRAPGVQILSTFPGGRYKNLNGTSMACPLAAGAISRLIQHNEVLSKELLWGDLIHTRQGNYKLGNVNILATYCIADSDRHPELALISANLADTASGDGDNRADAGEIIEFYPIIRNYWGQADNIRYWVKVGFNNQGDWVWDDTTLIHSLQDTAYFGKSLSSYAKATSLNPYRMAISPNCVDGRKINLTFFAICGNSSDTIQQLVTIDVENGVEIGGLLTEDLTLYPNVHYIVTRPLAIPEDVTLTIKPGTIIKFKDGTGISSLSPIEAHGNPDSMIVFTKADLSQGLTKGFSFEGDCKNVIFENFITNGSLFNKGAIFTNCIFRKLNIGGLFEEFAESTPHFIKCNIHASQIKGGSRSDTWDFSQCNMSDNDSPGFSYSHSAYCNIFNNRIIYGGERIPISIEEFADDPIVIRSEGNYIGTAVENIAHKYVMDMNWTYEPYGYGGVDLSTMLTRPSVEAHGIAWKILVDDIDAQDEFELLPPIGVGQHKCEVYFNRPMDVSIAPIISFGVRQPYTQHQVAENGSWSADSLIYTAYFTIDAKTVSDGLNTFKVYGAEDNEHFEIPEENFRFHMEVAAAGSMSTGLMAEAGLGKVTLTWETDEEDFADLLGYNIYRWTEGNDTIRINTSLIDAADTTFVDYDVVPGTAYYYVIRQMTTSLNSYDLSNPVAATSLTAIKGDANGSMTVDVADVVTEVAYLTNQNPQPFIFEAADVNSDNIINILDVVGTINIITHPQTHSQAVNEQNAYYYLENGILFVESDVVLGGVQFSFDANPKTMDIRVLEALNGFENVGVWTGENNYMFMAYSMSGKSIGVGKTALLQIGNADMTSIVLSDAQGHNVKAIPRASTAIDGTLFIPCSTKYINEGSLYIKIGDRIYNAMGTLIR